MILILHGLRNALFIFLSAAFLISGCGTDNGLGGRDTTPPSIPTNLSVSATTVTTISLTWAASTDDQTVGGVQGYRVFRNDSLVTTSSTVSATDEGLNPSTTYAYKVQAFDGSGNFSDQSAATSGTTTPDTQAPTAPTDVATNEHAQDAVRVSWTTATDNSRIIRYKIWRDGTLVDSVTSDLLTYANTGLVQNTNYIFTVSAVDAGNNDGPQSAPDTIRIEAPTAPTNLRGHGLSSTVTYLAWDAGIDNDAIGSYIVTRSGSPVDTVPSISLSLTEAGLAVGTLYPYQVIALDRIGLGSPASSGHNVATLQDNKVPDIKTVANFSIIAASVTNSGNSRLIQSLALTNAGVGVPTTGTVIIDGETELATTVANTARTDANNAKGVNGTDNGFGDITTTDYDLAAVTIGKPGTYTSAGNLSITSNVIIDAFGHEDAIYLFIINGDLTLGSDVQFSLANSAMGGNIYWHVTGTVTLNTGSRLYGTVLSTGDITLNTGAAVIGRLISDGAVNLNGNTIAPN